MVFTYDEGATARLSLGMPLHSEPYDEIRTEAYFGGLLPESDMTRLAIGKRYGINHNSRCSLLKAIGYDCAGAVSLHASGDSLPSVTQDTFPLTWKVLSEKAKIQECDSFHPVIDQMLRFFESECQQITQRFESGLQG